MEGLQAGLIEIFPKVDEDEVEAAGDVVDEGDGVTDPEIDKGGEAGLGAHLQGVGGSFGIDLDGGEVATGGACRFGQPDGGVAEGGSQFQDAWRGEAMDQDVEELSGFGADGPHGLEVDAVAPAWGRDREAEVLALHAGVVLLQYLDDGFVHGVSLEWSGPRSLRRSPRGGRAVLRPRPMRVGPVYGIGGRRLGPQGQGAGSGGLGRSDSWLGPSSWMRCRKRPAALW